jgi:hypothetical protein
MKLASEDAWVYLCSTLRTVTRSQICYTWWGAADIDAFVLLTGLAARIGKTNPLAGAAPPPWAAARPCRYSGHWQWPRVTAAAVAAAVATVARAAWISALCVALVPLAIAGVATAAVAVLGHGAAAFVLSLVLQPPCLVCTFTRHH